jgi:GH24 family phage-related lysozyme (muramidase)
MAPNIKYQDTYGDGLTRQILGKLLTKQAEDKARWLERQDLEYFVAEIEHWKQRCEELELELLMLENSYEPEEQTIQPKNRGLF